MNLGKLHLLDEFDDHKAIVARHIEQQKGRAVGPLNILEAGCGRGWPYRLADVPMTLTGIDMDEEALAARKRNGDLDVGILGDLRGISLPESNFDIIYSRFVLEHVLGAEAVLDNFLRWLKPGGLMILLFPDRDTVYSFLTRMTPFYFHILFKRYLVGEKTAGQKGFGPYPTYSEKVTSRRLFAEYCRSRNLLIIEEHGFGDDRFPRILHLFTKMFEFLSFQTLQSDHTNLLYVIRKPD